MTQPQLTKKGSRGHSGIFLAVYALAGVGFMIGWPDSSGFDLYKSLVPLVIAVPTAWLAYAFQRRVSYLNALRDLWKQLILSSEKRTQLHETSCVLFS